MIRRLRRKLFTAEFARLAPKLLRAAAILTIVALALMIWSMLDPTPLPVMLAMSVGQLIGTMAFALYALVVVLDLRRVRAARRASEELPLLDPKDEDRA